MEKQLSKQLYVSPSMKTLLLSAEEPLLTPLSFEGENSNPITE